MKGERYESANWDVRDKGLSKNEICVAIKDVLPSSMKDELEDNQEDYSSLAHGYWCDQLSKIEVKDNRKRYVTQIKRLVASKVASNSDRYESVRVPLNKRVRTGFIPSRKYQGKNTPNNPGIHRYCALCKKVRINKRKYMLHIFENCFGKRSNHKYIKKGLGVALGNRADAIKKYKNSEYKWKKYLKAIKKNNITIYSIAKKSSSSRELKKIKNIRAKSSKKRIYSSIDSSISGSDYDSSLSSDSD